MEGIDTALESRIWMLEWAGKTKGYFSGCSIESGLEQRSLVSIRPTFLMSM